MDIYLYLDASGQSNTTRLWGAFLVMGSEQNNSLQSIIKKFSAKCENFCELKGKWLSIDIMKDIISEVGQTINGYSTCYRYQADKATQQNFLHQLKKKKSLQNIIPFYTNLKKANQIKFIDIVYSIEKSLQSLFKYPHTKWNSLNVYIDNENLPISPEYRQVLCQYIHDHINQYKTCKINFVNIYEACDSEKVPGIQYVDIFLGYIREVFADIENMEISI